MSADTRMIEVKAADLIGPALDWAVAAAIGWIEPIFGVGRILYVEGDCYLMMEKPDPDEPDDVTEARHFNHYEQWSPCRIWSQGGRLIEKYGVLLSPPKSMMHVSGGPNAGWRETGTWGATIFGTERKHRRRSFDHPDQPLVAAMRAIVQFEQGDAVQVPAELVEAA